MQSAFNFRASAGLAKDYETCQVEKRAKYDQSNSDMTLEDLLEEYKECLRVNVYGPIDQSLDREHVR